VYDGLYLCVEVIGNEKVATQYVYIPVYLEPINRCDQNDLPEALQTCTGWGKITSVNFKVNNKKTIQDTKILFLDSETTAWEVLNHIVLKRISCKWWPLFAWCLRAEHLGDCKTDRLTFSMFSGVPEVHGRPHLFSDTLPVSLKFSTHNRVDFRSGTRSRGGIW